MKPHDKSDSFLRRVTKRVFKPILGTTLMNTLLGESQSGNDLSLTNESNDQPPVKKLCTSNNTFATANNQSNINAVLPEISAVNCVPSTSRQSSKFINQTNTSLRRTRIKRIRCPVCTKFVLSDKVDVHLVMCLTKGRLTYIEDVLKDDRGECAICFEKLIQGDIIARLPCLCMYHKICIDRWFDVNRSCPEHPGDLKKNIL